MAFTDKEKLNLALAEIEDLKSRLTRALLRRREEVLEGEMLRVPSQWGASLLNTPWSIGSISREDYLKIVTDKLKSESEIAKYVTYAIIQELVIHMTDEQFELVKSRKSLFI